jgi:hypothetical protein
VMMLLLLFSTWMKMANFQNFNIIITNGDIHSRSLFETQSVCLPN